MKSHKEFTKKYRLSYYFCLMMEGSGSVRTSVIRIREAQKLADPDPKHWYGITSYILKREYTLFSTVPVLYIKSVFTVHRMQ